MNVSSVAQDAQTTITSLMAGIGGAVSSELGDMMVSQFMDRKPALGQVGIEFCGRAVISAGTFALVSSMMPETSQNIFFSILFFAADQGLVRSAVSLSRGVVKGVTSTAPAMRATMSPVKPVESRAAMPCKGACPNY